MRPLRKKKYMGRLMYSCSAHKKGLCVWYDVLLRFSRLSTIKRCWLVSSSKINDFQLLWRIKKEWNAVWPPPVRAAPRRIDKKPLCRHAWFLIGRSSFSLAPKIFSFFSSCALITWFSSLSRSFWCSCDQKLDPWAHGRERFYIRVRGAARFVITSLALLVEIDA